MSWCLSSLTFCRINRNVVSLAVDLSKFQVTSGSCLTVRRTSLSSLVSRRIFTKSPNHVAAPSRFLIRDKMAESGKSESTPPSSPSHDRSKCIFCKIADGKEGNEIFYEDDEIIVFQDINPAAKHHLLVVPREHIPDSKSLLPHQLPLVERLIQVGDQVLLEQIKKKSPEITNPEQVPKRTGFHWPPFHTVSHLHLHVIAPSDQMGFIGRNIFRPSFWFVTPDYIVDRLEKMRVADQQKPSSDSN